MSCFTVAVLLMVPFAAAAQTSQPSDSLAISLAQKSTLALTGGAQISDVTLNANVTSILGSDYETGSGILRAKGTGESRVDLNLTNITRSEVRSIAGGIPGGAWATNAAASKGYPEHNCLTDAAWFFPALSSLSQTMNANFVFKYLGQAQHNGINAQHIQVFQVIPGFTTAQNLSAMDFYLDPVSFLPLSIDFNMHPDVDMNTNIPAEINFANYQQVNGVQVPFRIQRMLNGGVVLDITVSSAAFNTGLTDTLFTLP